MASETGDHGRPRTRGRTSSSRDLIVCALPNCVGGIFIEGWWYSPGAIGESWVLDFLGRPGRLRRPPWVRARAIRRPPERDRPPARRVEVDLLSAPVGERPTVAWEVRRSGGLAVPVREHVERPSRRVVHEFTPRGRARPASGRGGLMPTKTLWKVEYRRGLARLRPLPRSPDERMAEDFDEAVAEVQADHRPGPPGRPSTADAPAHRVGSTSDDHAQNTGTSRPPAARHHRRHTRSRRSSTPGRPSTTRRGRSDIQIRTVEKSRKCWCGTSMPTSTSRAA